MNGLFEYYFDIQSALSDILDDRAPWTVPCNNDILSHQITPVSNIVSDYPINSSDDGLRDEEETFEYKPVTVTRQQKFKSRPILSIPLLIKRGLMERIAVAFNKGDMTELRSAVYFYGRPNSRFRLVDEHAEQTGTGPASINAYFQRLYDKYPDGVMVIRNITSTEKNDVLCTTTKILFSGTMMLPTEKTSIKKPTDTNGEVVPLLNFPEKVESSLVRVLVSVNITEHRSLVDNHVLTFSPQLRLKSMRPYVLPPATDEK